MPTRRSREVSFHLQRKEIKSKTTKPKRKKRRATPPWVMGAKKVSQLEQEGKGDGKGYPKRGGERKRPGASMGPYPRQKWSGQHAHMVMEGESGGGCEKGRKGGR